MFNNKNSFILFIFIIFIFNSCDILRFSLFEVTSWTPGSGFHSIPENIVVSLSFSDTPDRDSVEKHFSLTSGNGNINGTFSWNGRKMIFIPLAPLEKNMDYNIRLSPEAHNTKGLSMDASFDQNFTTRPAFDHPLIVSIFPELYSEIDNLNSQIRLDFSIPVPITSLNNNISFSPSMTGFWITENEGMTAVFNPSEPWTINRRYEIKITASLAAYNGMTAGKDFTSVFFTGKDNEIPVLQKAHRITKNGTFISLDIDSHGYLYATEPLTENQGWEKDDRLHLIFSKPVDSLSLRNSVVIDNAPSLLMETPFSGSQNIYRTEYTFRFSSIPLYESRFAITVKPGIKDVSGNETKEEYVYRIYANGKHSKPPTLAGIRIPMAPENEFNKELVSYSTESIFENIPIKDSAENYPPGIDVNTWIELYFFTAESASIDLISIMENFTIETSNNVLAFSPKAVKTNNFTIYEPQQGWENLERIEVTGTLTNSLNFGVINFKILPGLRDNLGNKNDNLQSIPVIK